MIEPRIEEALEKLYECEYEHGPYPEDEETDAAMQAAAGEGLLIHRCGRYELTADGRVAGRNVVRRHRLAERLLADVLAVRNGTAEEDACRFEHCLQHGLDDRICTLLGHPRTCPHGKPIPEGECCRKAHADNIREVASLADGKPGDAGVVAYLATRDSREVQKMMAMGVLPGASIRLIRRFPSYVFQMGYSQFTVDRPLAENIFVHWDEPPAEQDKGPQADADAPSPADRRRRKRRRWGRRREKQSDAE